jgi:hypothetical protein
VRSQDTIDTPVEATPGSVNHATPFEFLNDEAIDNISVQEVTEIIPFIQYSGEDTIISDGKIDLSVEYGADGNNEDLKLVSEDLSEIYDGSNSVTWEGEGKAEPVNDQELNYVMEHRESQALGQPTLSLIKIDEQVIEPTLTPEIFTRISGIHAPSHQPLNRTLAVEPTASEEFDPSKEQPVISIPLDPVPTLQSTQSNIIFPKPDQPQGSHEAVHPDSIELYLQESLNELLPKVSAVSEEVIDPPLLTPATSVQTNIATLTLEASFETTALTSVLKHHLPAEPGALSIPGKLTNSVPGGVVTDIGEGLKVGSEDPNIERLNNVLKEVLNGDISENSRKETIPLYNDLTDFKTVMDEIQKKYQTFSDDSSSSDGTKINPEEIRELKFLKGLIDTLSSFRPNEIGSQGLSIKDDDESRKSQSVLGEMEDIPDDKFEILFSDAKAQASGDLLHQPLIEITGLDMSNVGEDGGKQKNENPEGSEHRKSYGSETDDKFSEDGYENDYDHEYEEDLKSDAVPLEGFSSGNEKHAEDTSRNQKSKSMQGFEKETKSSKSNLAFSSKISDEEDERLDEELEEDFEWSMDNEKYSEYSNQDTASKISKVSNGTSFEKPQKESNSNAADACQKYSFKEKDTISSKQSAKKKTESFLDKLKKNPSFLFNIEKDNKGSENHSEINDMFDFTKSDAIGLRSTLSVTILGCAILSSGFLLF